MTTSPHTPPDASASASRTHTPPNHPAQRNPADHPTPNRPPAPRNPGDRNPGDHPAAGHPPEARGGGPIRVVVADDQDLVRIGLRALLGSEEDMVVAGEAADGLAAVELTRTHRPDVVLMDVRMPGIDGIEATRRIAADPALAGSRVIVLTTFEIDAYVFDALRHGASGFLTKDTKPAELVRAIRLVAAGEALLSPSVTRRVVREFASRPARVLRPHPRLDALTDREREITALVGEGLSNDEIADRLTVSPATARTHVSRAMIKLQARDRAQLVVFAYQSGLVS